MLQTQTVSPDTLELIQRLMCNPLLKDFALAGGTGLALLLGHRMSVDIDLFSYKAFDSEHLRDELNTTFHFDYAECDINSINASIDGVKTQLLSHRYEQLMPIQQESEIRIYGIQDIAAMKLNAICNRGAKKDFWDYYELLQQLSINEMLSCYCAKYNIESSNTHQVVKSLSYFKDADKEPDPISLRDNISWEKIKEQVALSVTHLIQAP